MYLPFKSKSFISICSLYDQPRKAQRKISILQSKVNKNNDYINYTIHGKDHREEKELNHVLPAFIRDDNNNNYVCTLWYKNGKQHREDRDKGLILPARIDYCNNNIITQSWYKNNKLHRIEKDESGKTLPAYKYEFGSMRLYKWYKNDKKHRVDKDDKGKLLPANIGPYFEKEYWINGKEKNNICNIIKMIEYLCYIVPYLYYGYFYYSCAKLVYTFF